MGLLKETMQAIIRIDKSISTSIDLWRFETMRKDTNRKSAVKEVPRERTIDLRFSYPDDPNFGSRLKAVRLFTGRERCEFAAAIGLTEDQYIRLVNGKLAPWATLYRALSWRFNIDEGWITTGQLPQISDSPSIAMDKVTPLSGYDEGKDTIRETFLRAMPKEANLRLDSESGRDYSQSAQ